MVIHSVVDTVILRLSAFVVMRELLGSATVSMGSVAARCASFCLASELYVSDKPIHLLVIYMASELGRVESVFSSRCMSSVSKGLSAVSQVSAMVRRCEERAFRAKVLGIGLVLFVLIMPCVVEVLVPH